MASPDIVYAWEELPEYRATQQLGRTLGRILASLPRRSRMRLGRALLRGPVLIVCCIAAANAELPPEQQLSMEEREQFRRCALIAIEICRELLRLLRTERLGSLPDALVGLELLERIEAWVRRRALPAGVDWSD